MSYYIMFVIEKESHFLFEVLRKPLSSFKKLIFNIYGMSVFVDVILLLRVPNITHYTVDFSFLE